MFRFILMLLALNCVALGYELSNADSNAESRAAEARSRFKELQTNIKEGILSSPRTPINNQLRENKGPHLTAANNYWLISDIATSSSVCGQSGYIFDVYGSPLSENQCLSAGNGQFYQTNACSPASNGVNLVTEFFNTNDCTGNPASQSSYFLQNCGDSSSTVSYTCADATANPSQPWLTTTTPAGYLLAQFDTTDTTCAGVPVGYSVLVNGICQDEFEYNCPNGEAYSSTDCSGTPYTFPLNMGCQYVQSAQSVTKYGCV